MLGNVDTRVAVVVTAAAAACVKWVSYTDVKLSIVNLRLLYLGIGTFEVVDKPSS